MATPEMPQGDPPADTPLPPETAAPPTTPETAIQADTPPPGAADAAETPAAERPRRARAPLTAAAFAVRARRLDWVLVGLVLVLAFFLGSFAVANTDYWLHLATGRLIAHGEYTFGTDPFAVATDGVYWVNHAWLFDLVLYAVHSMAGVPGTVVFKALLIVALAAVLLAIRRPEQGLWLPVVCTVLALLALSPRLPLSPIVVSFLFLGLTVYLLHRATGADAPVALAGLSFSPLWLLPPLFALWANLDSWFVLGPLTVALFLLGVGVQRALAGRPAEHEKGQADAGRLALVLGVGLAACLANPHLQRVFTLPWDLAMLEVAGPDVLPDRMVGGALALQRLRPYLKEQIPAAKDSPLAQGYWTSSARGGNVAGLAYFPLFFLGLFSFALRASPVRSEETGPVRRFPAGLCAVWLVLALLSAWNVRLVPFFAVVGGPALALNLQDLFGRSRARAGEGLTARTQGWLLGGRALTALGCVLLLALAWPGWLHAAPDNPRRSHRVGWDAEVDPGLVELGRRVSELRAAGKLHNGFNVTLESGNYLPWFAAPGMRTFFDTRFDLFPHTADTYGQVRQALAEEADRLRGRVPRPKTMETIHRAFRDHGIDYLVFTGMDRDAGAGVIALRLLLESGQFVPLLFDGRNALFGWRDPLRSGADPFAGVAVDFYRQAFGPVPADHQAPAQGPAPPEGPPTLLTRYATGPASAPSTFSARLNLDCFLLLGQAWRGPYARLVQGTAWVAPLAAAPADPLPMLRGLVPLAVPHQQYYLMTGTATDLGPPPFPVLAVRNARRAVAEAPDNADAWRALADGYAILGRDLEQHWTPQRAAGSHHQLLTRQTLRHVQRVAALRTALRLQPDNAELHDQLARLFLEMNYLDAARYHLEKVLEHRDSLIRRGNPKAEAERVKRIEREAKAVADEVKRRSDEYELQAAGQRSPMNRMALALLAPTRVRNAKGAEAKVERGLALQALDGLREAWERIGSLDAKEQAGAIDWRVRLLLMLGETKELHENFGPDVKKVLGPAHELLVAVALGNYADADRVLGQLEEEIEKVLPASKASGLIAAWERKMARERQVIVASFLPWVPVVPALQPLPLPSTHHLAPFALTVQMPPEVREALGVLGQRAEWRSFRGLLALERGKTRQAVAYLRGAQELVRGRSDYPNRPVAVRYLTLLERQQGAASR